MNFASIITAILSTLTGALPLLLPLLNDPNFQKILAAIQADLNTKIAGGVPPVTATQQAGGQLHAAIALHLTGNPIADVQTWLAQFKQPTGGATGTFTS
jgi:hypothetical protein